MVPSKSPGADSSTDQPPSDLRSQAIDRFVSLWGEMASTWGINRTMARIHALLYCVEHPLNTDQIMERLGVSRGNANMNLRALVEWDLVTKTQQIESRKDHYRAEKDVWQITARIIEERRRREVQPVRKRLQNCVDLLAGEDDAIGDQPEDVQILHRRLTNLTELVQVFEGVTEVLLPLVEREDAQQIEQLVDFARALQDPDTGGADASH